MENSMTMKLKRKDLDDVNYDFSDFSLSSPARKIRRLDAELPPIVEEEEVEIPLGYQQTMPGDTVSNATSNQIDRLDIEELPMVPENEERALVLFKPVNNSLFNSSSNYSVDPNLISSFKNQFMGSHLIASRSSGTDECPTDIDDEAEENKCRAVIPWVPSQQLNPRSTAFDYQPDISEAMDAEEMEADSATATMEIEDASDSNTGVGQEKTEDINHLMSNQWQQQHCMIPQPLLNSTTPIVWYR